MNTRASTLLRRYRAPSMKVGTRRFAPRLAAWALLGLVACSGTGAPPPRLHDGPPAPGLVRDGLGADVDAQDVRTTLFANWDAFVDPEGLPVVYEWSIGTAPGRTDVLPWTSVAGSTNASTEGVALPTGVPLHVNVRATDMAGNRSPAASSDGIVVGEPVLTTAPPLRVGSDDAKPAPSGHLAAVDRAGITWTFDQPVLCGRFVNGDWWVRGPVRIVAIAPGGQLDGERARHGSMLDPDPRQLVQGYDSAMFGEDDGGRYDASVNVALGITRERPFELQPGHSLVSTISHPQPGQLPQLESCAVLTCLAEPPPPNAFRPPYCGTDKRCRWTADAIDANRFPALQPVPGTPTLRELVDRCEGTWLDHLPGWAGAYLHPRNTMPDYGRGLADLVGQAGLALLLEGAPADKRALAIALVQIGIDVHGIVRNGGRFLADGGSGAGRKFPLLLAATLLHDDELRESASLPSRPFAEDVQTFVVAETAPGVINQGQGGYGPEDVGLAEWGNHHADDPSADKKAWTGDPYRRCCTANVWCGFVLAARALGMQAAWNHPPLFDYVDRYMQIEPRGEWTRAFSPFAERMWDAYRTAF